METNGPRPVYEFEVDTLHQMLREERERLKALADRKDTAAMKWTRALCGRRIEALQTAIEALGGAL